MKNKYIKPLILVVAFLILSLVTVSSFAYFSASVQGNDSAYDTVITTGQMALMLNDGEQVGLNNAIPGDSITKEFSVKNTGTVETTYDVYFSELFNTFEDKNDLVYKLESLNGCADNTEKVIPGVSSDESKMVSSCLINPNQTHNYTLTVTFKNDGTNQDDNKGKMFRTKISVNDYKAYYVGYLDISKFGSRIKNLGISTEDVISIEKNDTPPIEIDNAIDIADEISDYPLYAWYSDGTVNLYTENNTVMLNDLPGRQMISEFNNLEKIDFSLFDTSKMTKMNDMFAGFSKLTEVIFGENFDTSNVTNMQYMFASCGIKKLDLSNFNTSKVTNMAHMFGGAKIEEITLGNNFDTSNVTNMYGMFSGLSNVVSIDLGNKFKPVGNDLSNMFSGLWNLRSIYFGENFDTSNVTNMQYMFADCSSLIDLDLSAFDTSNVTNMKSMFGHCTNLKSLNVSNFDTSNVTDMSNMFFGLNSLNTLDVSNFNTSKVTNMSDMFSAMVNIDILDLSSFNTSKVTDMSYMFSGMNNLKTIYVSNMWNISSVTSDAFIFYNNSNLVGGSGTTYSSGYVSSKYARIDDPTNGKPGYLTLKTN